MWATRRSYEQCSNCTSVVVRTRSPNLRVNGFEFFLFYRGPAPNLFKTSPPFHPFQRRTNQQSNGVATTTDNTNICTAAKYACNSF